MNQSQAIRHITNNDITAIDNETFVKSYILNSSDRAMAIYIWLWQFDRTNSVNGNWVPTVEKITLDKGVGKYVTSYSLSYKACYRRKRSY